MNIPIVFASDENYLPYCSVTIESIKQNMQRNSDIYIYIAYKNFKRFARLFYK